MSGEGASDIQASIVMNVLGLAELGVYGFRSWMIQDYDRPYEVILNLFGESKRPMFEPLTKGANPNCRPRIIAHPEPNYFNTSAANNYGLYQARGRYVIFVNADMIYPGKFLTRAMGELERGDISYAVAARVNLTEAISSKLKPASEYSGP